MDILLEMAGQGRHPFVLGGQAKGIYVIRVCGDEGEDVIRCVVMRVRM